MSEVIVRVLADGATEVDWPGGCVWVEPDGELNLGDVPASAIPPAAMAQIVEHHPVTAAFRRQLEQARSVAIQLEQQLAAAEAVRRG